MEQHSQKKKNACNPDRSSNENHLPANDELKTQNKAFFNKIEKLEQQIKELEEQNRAKDRTISWDGAALSQKITTIAKLQDLLAAQNQKVIELEQHVTLLQQSNSFKIGRAMTAPLRLCQKIIPSNNTPSPEQESASTTNFRRPTHTTSYTPGVINLGGQLQAFYGKHRSGWGYAIMHLAPLNHYNGIYCDTFIERTFVWQPGEIQPTLKPWIGFIHVPPNMPDWFHSDQTNDTIFQSRAWEKSLPYCKGLFTLSNYHKKNLETKLDIPINALIHPTGRSPVTWRWESFEKNAHRKIVQVGWWLRKLHAIFELPESSYEKVFLNVGSDPYFEKIFTREREWRKAQGLFQESMYDSATTIDYLPNEQYDQLLSENIMFADLYDSSANNLVIECIVRDTPLLINPLEPVMEYLGKDYPFYFSSHQEAVDKANDLDLVRETHEYLKHHPVKEKLTGEYFLESFKNSSIFNKL